MSATYLPAWGDLVWIDFNSQRGREQAGVRPGLIVSNSFYNRRNKLALICPITSKRKGYPFEVALPAGCGVAGVVLSDQTKTIDCVARAPRFIAKCPAEVVADVIGHIRALMIEI